MVPCVKNGKGPQGEDGVFSVAVMLCIFQTNCKKYS